VAVPDPPAPLRPAGLDDLAEVAAAAGLRRVQMVAWRDLDDPEAGGSELHAHRIAGLWAAAGLEVHVRTSAVAGQRATVVRDGYRVDRRSGRYAVFWDTAWRGWRRGAAPGEGLVEVWNGMPYFSPLWYRGPKVVFLHHVHAQMWRMVLPGALGRAGELVERRLAPPLYRSSRLVTLSESSKAEIVDQLGARPDRVTVAPPGVDPRFSPGPGRSPVPLVVAVGRLVPVKRLNQLVEALARVRADHPQLRAVLLGEGYERQALEELRHRLGADDWLEMPGHVADDELVAWYRRAWVVTSASLREGWGMTLTEAAACGTPAVVTDIAGHRDAVVDGRTGVLVPEPADLAPALSALLADPARRAEMGRAAVERSRWFTWEATARATLEALASEVARQSRRP
jgi:glycosyltransferase involved in cell wall biosynthesis